MTFFYFDDDDSGDDDDDSDDDICRQDCWTWYDPLPYLSCSIKAKVSSINSRVFPLCYIYLGLWEFFSDAENYYYLFEWKASITSFQLYKVYINGNRIINEFVLNTLQIRLLILPSSVANTVEVERVSGWLRRIWGQSLEVGAQIYNFEHFTILSSLQFWIIHRFEHLTIC